MFLQVACGKSYIWSEIVRADLEISRMCVPQSAVPVRTLITDVLTVRTRQTVCAGV